jgi:hypothetical protein
MEILDRYFRLNLKSRESLNSMKKLMGTNASSPVETSTRVNSLREFNTSNSPILNGAMRMSKSSENLNEAETDEMIERNEEARLAEEALTVNIKLLKKQKAKFLRLQRILSRNVFLIPLCAIFTVLSAACIFSSTLSDYYEFISYDINELNYLIQLENNRTLSFFNQSIKPSTIYTTTSRRGLFTHSPFHLSQFNYYFYEISSFDDYYLVTRRNYTYKDNSTVRTNVLFATFSGIWKHCNYLSGIKKAIFFLSLKKFMRIY